jgi:hypothetical protein
VITVVDMVAVTAVGMEVDMVAVTAAVEVVVNFQRRHFSRSSKSRGLFPLRPQRRR